MSKAYNDSRGVSRAYRMSLDQGTLRMWRPEPGFSQRFSGSFSSDGNRITP
ncbi:hypothetical protein AB0M22_31040 [Nocardia sp. NPDC051756]|uniref:hypothetical protein n=1 Tax=Nocardia sp. NPDC051756 TaxID=3154751 RepID=UPI00341AA087